MREIGKWNIFLISFAAHLDGCQIHQLFAKEKVKAEQILFSK
jgi:hypothetical protein